MGQDCVHAVIRASYTIQSVVAHHIRGSLVPRPFEVISMDGLGTRLHQILY